MWLTRRNSLTWEYCTPTPTTTEDLQLDGGRSKELVLNTQSTFEGILQWTIGQLILVETYYNEQQGNWYWWKHTTMNNRATDTGGNILQWTTGQLILVETDYSEQQGNWYWWKQTTVNNRATDTGGNRLQWTIGQLILVETDYNEQ